MDNPNLFDEIENSEVVIPFSTIQELDRLKTRDGEKGERARDAIRHLEEILIDNEVEYGTNTISVIEDDSSIEKVDDRVIKLCGDLMFDTYYLDKERDITLLTNDLNMKIKARTQGIHSESYYGNFESEYKGYQDIYILDKEMNHLFSEGFVCPRIDLDVDVNEYVNFFTPEGGSALTKYIGDNTFILLGQNLQAWGEKPKNREQIYAFDALLDEEIPLVCLTGAAGSGKNYLTLAVALEKTKERPKYDKIIITRTLHHTGGATIGFLPGTKDEKMTPWFGGMWDNLEQLLGSRENAEMLLEQGLIEMCPFEYMRGRSLKNKFVILDEGQNTSKSDVKTLITRMGKNSKLVILGDIDQRDNKKVSRESNGLKQTIKFFHKEDYHKYMAHIQLTSGKLRSELAEIASRM